MKKFREIVLKIGAVVAGLVALLFGIAAITAFAEKKTSAGVIGLFFTALPVVLLIMCIRKLQGGKGVVKNDKIEPDETFGSPASPATDYTALLAEKDRLIEKYRLEAQRAVKADVDADKEITAEQRTLTELEEMIAEKSAEYAEIKRQCEESQKTIESNANKVVRLKEIYKSFQYSIKVYENDPSSRLNEALISTAEESLLPIVELHLNCMNVKQLKAKYNQVQRSIQETFKRYEGRYTTKANAAIYKLMVIALEAELQNVLYSLRYSKLDSSIDAIKEITARYLAISVDGNQSIAPTMQKFIGEIEYLFIEAVKVEYEYYTQRERIKEEQRALKEQMRQEAEERRILEQQKKQIEKEESKYITEIDSVKAQISACSDDEQLRKLNEKIAQLENQLEAVNEQKDEIIKLQNGKAGYVYVISNVGSFGSDVFKVGMTRRLEPMDRVKELSSASVPFSFDVHSLIFSDDAVGLENTLHKELNSRRVNKINLRKEFFRVSMDELEALVYKHEPAAEFNRTMLAEEYNQGLSLTEPVMELSEDEFEEE